MSEAQHNRFDLSEFVLGYLEEQGSVIMPPAFGVYEVLMPDDLAARLALSEYAHLSFAAPLEGQPEEAALQLSVNHPLVETIAQTMTQQPANAQAYISGLRVDKRGLIEIARKSLSLPNARIDPLPHTQEEGAQHHYLLCNFKVTFVSEEKQEELVTVVMDVQAGHAVLQPAILQRLEIIDSEPTFGELTLAPPRWIGAGSDLYSETLPALLPRAERALRQRLTEQVTAMVTRMERHLALDLARIGDYYDELTADLQRRQGRSATEDAERKQSLDDKLAALANERAAKLQDVRSRYGVRVEMELVNVLLVAQAKVILPVSINNRTTTLTRTIVWDPLLHRLEPLVCDVCGEPGEGLQLCSGGHLAHNACLTPQCIDCKRAFCQLCAAQVGECVVCHRSVCRPSMITCTTCQRGTCSEHQQLCHAAEGQPVNLAQLATPPVAPPSSTPPVAKLSAPTSPSTQKPIGKAALKPPLNAPSKPPLGKKLPASPTPPATSAPIVKGVGIKVEINDVEPTIVFFVMRSTNKVLATRTIRLTPQGILIQCQCEKSPCPAHSYYHRPAPVTAITEQIEEQLRKLQQEYLIPSKKIDYYLREGHEWTEIKRFGLPAIWRDPERVNEAIGGFQQLVSK